METSAILLIYHHPLQPSSPTIMEHVRAFSRNSQFAIVPLNTELGFPAQLRQIRFQAVVFHYSLFGGVPFKLNSRYWDHFTRNSANFRIALFQDEYRFWPERVHFLREFAVDHVYTLIEPAHFKDTYNKYFPHLPLTYNLTGYVGPEIIDLARRFAKPAGDRRWDIGYRARKLPFSMGRGSQEKHWIAGQFQRRAAGLGLQLNLDGPRLHGDDWYKLLGDCRAVLGVESGVSIFDVDNQMHPQYKRLMAENPNASFEEVSARLLQPFEDKIYYRTISPRHFEAAAFRNCQIMFEGKYSGIMRPVDHYIPLKKDFSNFDEVVRMYRDRSLRKEIVERAYQDLIASGNYSYKRFVRGFDRTLQDAGLSPRPALQNVESVQQLLDADLGYRRFTHRVRRKKIGRLFCHVLPQLSRRWLGEAA